MSSQQRPDGRPLDSSTHRPISLDLRCLSRPDGSAKICIGNSSATASAVGPAAPRSVRHEEFDHEREGGGAATVTVSIRRYRSPDAASERELESWISGTLCGCVAAPRRTAVQIGCHIGEGDGGAECAALNACVAAMVDAGVAMKYVPVAVAVGLLGGGALLLDPTLEEEQECLAVVTVVIQSSAKRCPDPTDDKNILSTFVTYCSDKHVSIFPSPDDYVNTCVLASRASTVMTDLYRQAVSKRIESEEKTFRAV